MKVGGEEDRDLYILFIINIFFLVICSNAFNRLVFRFSIGIDYNKNYNNSCFRVRPLLGLDNLIYKKFYFYLSFFLF